jgi:hypothetical protein
MLCVPRSKIFLAGIPHFSNLNIYIFFNVYQGTNSWGECNQKLLVPSWQLVRLNVFDRPRVQQAMLEMEEEIEYGLGREDIVNGINVGDNIVVPCESENGE